MQIIVSILDKQKISMPINYNQQLRQGIFYTLSESEHYHRFLEENPTDEKGEYEHFTFSPISGSYRIDGSRIIFSNSIYFEIRTPSRQFGDLLKDTIFSRGFLHFDGKELPVRMLKIYERHIDSREIHAVSISPIIARESHSDGKIDYFTPNDLRFSKIINHELKRRYEEVFSHEMPGELYSETLVLPKKVTAKLNDSWISAYHGIMRLRADPQLLNFVFNEGLGHFTNAGYGIMDMKAYEQR